MCLPGRHANVHGADWGSDKQGIASDYDKTAGELLHSRVSAYRLYDLIRSTSNKLKKQISDMYIASLFSPPRMLNNNFRFILEAIGSEVAHVPLSLFNFEYPIGCACLLE